MRTLQGRDKVILCVSMLVAGVLLSVTQARSGMIDPAFDIGKSMSGRPTDYTVFVGPSMAVAEAPEVAVSDAARGYTVWTPLVDAEKDAAFVSAHGPDSVFVIGGDPFGFWTVAPNDTPDGAPSTIPANAGSSESLPIIVSAGAVLVTSLLGCRLIAPPRQKPRKKKRYPNGTLRSRQDDDTDGIADGLRYIAGSLTPRFLKRRKKSKRKAASRSGRAGDTPETTIGDVARALRDTVKPRRRRRKRRRASRAYATPANH